MAETAILPSNYDTQQAGPSRPSPPASFHSPLPASLLEDVNMEESGVSKGESSGAAFEEAAHLLLSISSVVDQRLVPLAHTSEESTTSPTNPSEAAYPYTPPEDPQPPHSSILSTSISNHLALADQHDLPLNGSAPDIVKPKTKRKRNAQAGPSRRTSADRPSLERDRPPHWMGEANTVIRCICGIDEDDGFTVQCEGCGAWEHGQCFGYLDTVSLPDTYFCELCIPRPVDAISARQRQLAGPSHYDARRSATSPAIGSVTEKEKAKPRSKQKRARTGSVIDGDGDLLDSRKDPSPTTMGPPSILKPKRRPVTNKPRMKPSVDLTPGLSFKEPLPPPVDMDDDYFRIEPWALEYTPIKENVIRGGMARHLLGNLWREWADAENDDMRERRQSPQNPPGLPSPAETGVLRFSPDSLFPATDFRILAAPIPPVFLVAPDLDELILPTSVHAIEQNPSFLPLNYAEVSSSGVYTQPALYGVFADRPINAGCFLGEYRGEIIDCETYRKDPINQYSALGIPKPYVRSIGPPINLMIDARGYGADLRFIRSGCHPNAVIRPLYWRKFDESPQKLKFGVFAAADIGKKEEVVLAWEWDDQHVVHSMRSIIKASAHVDGTIGSPAVTTDEATIHQVIRKFDTVLTHLLGTFSACACGGMATCAISQMRHLVAGTDNEIPNGQRPVRANIGELVGAVRGWRRREIEADTARRSATADTFDTRLGTSRSPVLDEEVSMRIGNSFDIVEMPIRDDSAPAVRPIEDAIVSVASPTSAVGIPKMASSSSLSSAASSQLLSHHSDMDLDDGHESDATTVTIPKSEFSDSEGETGSVITAKSVQHAPNRGRRVLSPVILPKVDRNIQASDSADIILSKELDDLSSPKREKPVVTVTVKSKATTKRARPGPKKSRFVRSDSDSEGDAILPPPDAFFAPRTANIRLETQAIESDKDPVVILGPPLTPVDAAVEQTMFVEDDQLELEPLPLREPTPEPRGATPVLREPTPPPPEPPKKVSISEYLKNHKIRKETATVPLPLTPAAKNGGEISTSGKPDPDYNPPRLNLFEHLPSRTPGTPAHSTPSFITTSLPIESPKPLVTPTAYVPRNEYFPAQPLSTSFAPRVSSSYTPRQSSTSSSETETPGLSYTPRSTFDTASYFPRQATMASELDIPGFGSAPKSTPEVSAYLPRQDNPPYFTPREERPAHTPPQLPPHREQPPHQSYTPLPRPPPPQALPPASVPRIPPTGPKMPPTGPRGATWNPPTSPSASTRGAFAPAPIRGLGTGFGRGGAGFGVDRPTSAGFGVRQNGFGERNGFSEGVGFGGRGAPRGRGRGL